jgi:hypothetical protein
MFSSLSLMFWKETIKAITASPLVMWKASFTKKMRFLFTTFDGNAKPPEGCSARNVKKSLNLPPYCWWLCLQKRFYHYFV